MIAFFLSMPGVALWNGRWSGEHGRILTLTERTKSREEARSGRD